MIPIIYYSFYYYRKVMGQTLCKDQVDTRLARTGLILWGDYVNADTRTIIAVLEMCGEKYTFKQLDTLANKHLED
jgi:hypothetical protein